MKFTGSSYQRRANVEQIICAAQLSGDEKFIVCNADEGDSGTFADRMLMEGDPFVLLEGMAIAEIGRAHV